MYKINRNTIIFTPKEKLYEWLKENDPEISFTFDQLKPQKVIFLVKELNDANKAEKYMRDNSASLGLLILSSLNIEIPIPPNKRGWETLREWFSIEWHKNVWDIEDEKIIKEI